jgi:predicted RNase H-like nuclease
MKKKSPSSVSSPTFVGVDGCKRGWVAIELSNRGFQRARTFPTFAKLFAACERAKVIAVDMPIGLVDRERTADTAARDYLVGQSSCVFNSPPRAALRADSYEAASAIARDVSERGLSRQSYALFEKIREVDEFIDDTRIHEVHPEVSFRVLNGDIRLLHGKKTWGGAHLRRRRLVDAGIVVPDDLGEVDPVAVDDILDAAIAAWSARRIARGQARSFPANASQQDASGRMIAIWA